jgi:hypothetical protein
MVVKKCRVDGCCKTSRFMVSGMCPMHYQRLRIHGTTKRPLRQRLPLEQRMAAQVKIRGNNDCWLWTGYTSKAGYGRIRGADGRKRLAHVVALELRLGRTLTKNALHTCDVPSCCNPNHLYEGTQKQNVQDCIDRGRRHVHRGEAHYKAKLTAVDVRVIRRRVRNGEDRGALAAEYDVTRGHISVIARRDSWRSV